MSTRATAAFAVTGWSPTPYDEAADGPTLSRVTIRKAFSGDFDGESVGEGLFCGGADPAAGAGYVVSERFTGRLHGSEGTFVLQHGGTVGPDVPARSFGTIVPGSGTGGLTGLQGTAEFGQDHTLTLDYRLP